MATVLQWVCHGKWAIRCFNGEQKKQSKKNRTKKAGWSLQSHLSLLPVYFTWTLLPLLSVRSLCPACFTCFLCAITPDFSEQLLISRFQNHDIGIRCGAEKHFKHAGQVVFSWCFSLGTKGQSTRLQMVHVWPLLSCTISNQPASCVFFHAEPWLSPLSL